MEFGGGVGGTAGGGLGCEEGGGLGRTLGDVDGTGLGGDVGIVAGGGTGGDGLVDGETDVGRFPLAILVGGMKFPPSSLDAPHPTKTVLANSSTAPIDVAVANEFPRSIRIFFTPFSPIIG